MRIGDTKGPKRIQPVSPAGAYRKAQDMQTGATSGPGDAVSVMGIPETELTPKVKSAIMTLMEEVEALRQELDHAKERMRHLEEQADRDGFLPVLNRRAFVRELSRIRSFGQRYDIRASIVYIDLNDFKEVNDKYGHAAGDAVLEHVTKVLTKNIRETDIVGRLGGDEFGLILPNALEEAAAKKAEQLERMLTAKPVRHGDNLITIGASFGTYTMRPDDDIEHALAKADEAMYEKKRQKQESAED